jgi:hypothetical protein
MGGVCGERRGAYGVWMANPKERYQLGYLGIDIRIILKGISRKSVARALTGLFWLRVENRWWAVVEAAVNLLFP